MTKVEENRFRDILRKKQTDLQRDGTSGREALVIEESADELDRIQHAQERDFALGSLDRNARLLREVRAAVARIDAGTFGICLDCEDEISTRRLAAVPWTASCILCQEVAEMASQPASVFEELASASAD